VAAVLVVTRNEVLRVARLDNTNATNQDDADKAIADEQEAIEQTLSASALADSTLTALLRRNVAKLLAAEVLETITREEARSGTFQGLGITISQVPDHAGRLREEARAILVPYARRRTGAMVPDVASPAGQAAQETLYGKTEAARHSSTSSASDGW